MGYQLSDRWPLVFFPGYVLKIPFSLLIRTSESHTAPCCLGYFIVRWGWEEALLSLEGGVRMFTGQCSTHAEAWHVVWLQAVPISTSVISSPNYMERQPPVLPTPGSLLAEWELSGICMGKGGPTGRMGGQNPSWFCSLLPISDFPVRCNFSDTNIKEEKLESVTEPGSHGFGKIGRLAGEPPGAPVSIYPEMRWHMSSSTAGFLS